MAPSKVEPRLIKAAISLFGDFGYKSVTIKDLAEKADCEEWNIYRLFGGKEGLYKRAIEVVVKSASDDMAGFALHLFSSGAQRNVEPRKLVSTVVHHWYSSLSLSGARLILQARMDKSQKVQADVPLGLVVGIIENILEPSSKTSRKGQSGTRTRAELLVKALLDLKVTYPAGKETAYSGRKELDEVNRYLQEWLGTIDWKQ
jgi:AcrR family transcriptional regulator